MVSHIGRETARFNEWLCSGASLLISDWEMYPLPRYLNMKGSKAKNKKHKSEVENNLFCKTNMI